MTTTELAQKTGLTRTRLGQLRKSILTKGTDYDIQINAKNAAQITYTASGVEKIMNRNTLHYSEKSGRPRKHPVSDKPKRPRGRPKKKGAQP